MQINNEHQKYKYPNALKSVNFKGQTIPIKQITYTHCRKHTI